jgi:hypothetical protein
VVLFRTTPEVTLVNLLLLASSGFSRSSLVRHTRWQSKVYQFYMLERFSPSPTKKSPFQVSLPTRAQLAIGCPLKGAPQAAQSFGYKQLLSLDL